MAFQDLKQFFYGVPFVQCLEEKQTWEPLLVCTRRQTLEQSLKIETITISGQHQRPSNGQAPPPTPVHVLEDVLND